jgi:hypothetical protein
VFHKPFDQADAQDLAYFMLDWHIYDHVAKTSDEVDIQVGHCTPFDPAIDWHGKAGWLHFRCGATASGYGTWTIVLHRRPKQCGYVGTVTRTK